MGYRLYKISSHYTNLQVLDAPGLVDDYYLNLLDWGKNNVLAVALRECVFLWNASTGSTCKVVDTGSESNIITSVCWGANDILAIGKTDSEVLLWDTARDKEVCSKYLGLIVF